MNATRTVSESGGLPAHYIDRFLDRLRTAHYSEVSLRKKRRVLCAFSGWMENRNIDLIDLDESVTARFMNSMIDASRDRVQRARPTLRQFLAYLRAEAIVCSPTLGGQSEIARIYRRYLDHLRQDRGLAKNSLLVYGPFIRDFLDSHSAGDGTILPDAFDAVTIRDHFLAYSKGRSAEYTRLMAVALRSFCHFLFLRGDTVRDLYESVPSVRKWRQSTVPTFLTPEQQEALIASADRSTSTGRRDYAILLLLARLGLRAGEIVAMQLDDIHWRSGELVVHGKGQMVEHVPLPSEVGEAIATYLRDGRGASASRYVFLRRLAPRVGLAGPAAIGKIVCQAFARAGFRPACRGAAHLFRHGLATTMIRHGASMAEIAEVLRHRSQDSTAIYAKIAFEDLRGVARSWPTAGGAI
ncbi:site-specific integrase [Paraburkholderia sabiae]|uniref:Site-specific integrase n=1 Tax=Paraburkholderia sabiae TaxID=273251 RepID=A0ABU9QST3_9BURK|nr:site-specific integrase [Paraburkholderia sabiae]WJZ79494.1 site-specific integrase [Paraburkholderia sabiae]CAD6563403.1 Tyrosine recombinase XerC [Paraburkholderia sabiae]